jgi:ATP-dependent Clp endopeptidase proteolytic subunit ClpP
MKTAHIYIYGEIVSSQDKHASEYGYVNLANVKADYEKQKECEEITLHIHCIGGDVTEGYAIHDFIRLQKKPVTTIIEGVCASMGTIVHLSGDPDKRLATSMIEYMIHPVSGGAYGTAEDMQKSVDYIKKATLQAAKFYSEKTGITEEKVLELMKAETFMTAEEAMAHGFISGIVPTMKAITKFDLKKDNKKDNKMSKKKMTKAQTESTLDVMLAKMKKILSGGQGATMKLVTAADGETEIDFTDLADDDTPSVDDVATIDGSDAEGEYLMPSGETFVFTAGVLTAITPAEEEDEDESEEVVALKLENEQMKAKALKDAKTLKALQKASDATAKSLLEATQVMTAMQKDIKAVKASMSSGFEAGNGDGNSNHSQDGKQKSRQLFKEKTN